MRIRLFAAAFVALTVATPAWAGPLSPKHVPADASAVVHFDFDAFRGSKVYGALSKELAKEISKAKTDLAKDLGPLDIDLLLDVGSVTFWARGDTPDEGAIVIDGGKTAQILSLLDKLPDHKTQKSQGLTIHTIADQAFVAIHGALVIVSEDAANVRHAIDVIDGKKASLAKSGHALKNRGAFFTVMVRDKAAKALSTHTRSALLSSGDIKSGLLQIGERKNKIFAHVEVETDSAEEARKVAQLVQGGAAFLALAADSPELSSLLDTLVVKASKAMVSAEISVDSKMVVDLIKDEI